MIILGGLLISFAWGDTPGQMVDQTTTDVQNYWNTAPNQIFVDPSSSDLVLGYTWSDDPTWSSWKARVQNLGSGMSSDMPDIDEFGWGLPGIHRSPWGNLLVNAVSGAQAWFYASEWANGVALFIELEPGLGEYEQMYWFDENPMGGPASNLNCWVQVDANGVIHVLAYDGWGYGYIYKQSVDGGFTFSPGYVFGHGDEEWPNLYANVDFYGQDNPYGAILASDGNGQVAIACTDQGGNIWLVESFDQGQTWPDSEGVINVTGYEEFGGEEFAKPDRFIDAVYDNNGELHLVWEASYWLDEGQEGERHPWPGNGVEGPYPAGKRGQIQHWSSSTGVSTAVVSAYPLTDLDASYIGITGREKGCMVSMPTLAYDATNNHLYVGYVQYDEMNGAWTIDDEYRSSGDLYLTRSDDGGASWYVPQNISDSDDWDERHLVLNEQVLDGTVHMMYIADTQPGYEILNEFGTPQVSGVYYHNIQFTPGDIAIFGCTDAGAYNFDPLANVDDGSCIYDIDIYGCTDPEALNYNPEATIDDGSCVYGEANYALNLDGLNDFVLIPDHNDLDFGDYYTLEAWIYPESFTWLGGIVSKYMTSGSNGWILRLTADAPYTGLHFDEMTTATGVLQADQWVHVAAVRSRMVRTLYINGIPEPLSGTALGVTSNNDPVRIGSDFSSRYFDGIVDEVRLWNVARTQAEIQGAMDESLSGDEPGLVAYYPFNEGFGEVTEDMTGHGHDGTIFGAPAWVPGVGGEVMLGDINMDSELDILDAVMMVAIIVGLETGTEYQQDACDANEDGTLDVLDVVLVISWILADDLERGPYLTGARFKITDTDLSLSGDGQIAGFQIKLGNQAQVKNIRLGPDWHWVQHLGQILAVSLKGSSLNPKSALTFDIPPVIEQILVADWHGQGLIASNLDQLHSFTLGTPYPNPFNPVTQFSITISEQVDTKVEIINLRGQVVTTLADGILSPGVYSYNWDATTATSGVYWIRLTAGDRQLSQKCILIK